MLYFILFLVSSICIFYILYKLDKSDINKAPDGRKLTSEVIKEYQENQDFNEQSVFDEVK